MMTILSIRDNVYLIRINRLCSNPERSPTEPPYNFLRITHMLALNNRYDLPSHVHRPELKSNKLNDPKD